MKKTALLYIIGGFVVGVLATTYYFNSNTNTHRLSQGSMMMGENTYMDMDSMMNGMTLGLDGKIGNDFDKAFLAEMIIHHQGAVVMAKAVLKNSTRPELIKLANDIISAQTGEIEMMKGWEKSWFNI